MGRKSKIDSFEKAFLDYIRNESLIYEGEKVLIAYSGGLDSSVLLHLFNECKDKLAIDLHICYFNHNMRGEESDKEVEFITETCTEYGLPFNMDTGDVLNYAHENGISLQESARSLRYDFFDKIAGDVRADKIATGHHFDDQAETVLMRFLQGSSVKALRGIPVLRDKYIRPLLWAKRSELFEFAGIGGIAFFEDSSNLKTDYLRNQIRLEILPYLREKLGTNIDLILVKHGKKFQNVSDLMASLTSDAINATVISHEKDKIVLDIASLKNYFTILQQDIFFDCFKRLGETNDSHISRYAQKVIELLNGTIKRKSTYITQELIAYQDKNFVTICRKQNRNFEFTIEIGKEYAVPWENRLFQADIVYFESLKIPESIAGMKNNRWDEVVDRQALVEPLILRSWQPGDRFRPLGMQHRKKISDFFIDLKIPEDLKMRFPILVDQEKIVWICGMRIDDRVKITPDTKEIVGLKYAVMQKIQNN